MYNHILDQFYMLTEVPIRQYDGKNKLLNSKGDNFKIEDDVLAFFENLQLDSFKNYPVKININKDVYIIITRENNSYFTLGPLTNNENVKDYPYKPEALSGYIVRLLNELCEDYIEEEENPYSYHINKALEFIDKNFDQDVNLEQTSEHLALNKCYFCSLLKEETGLTFTQYLNQKRVEEAKTLLKETELSIIDISEKIGFNSQSYFNVIFKRETGLTPLRYRYKNT